MENVRTRCAKWCHTSTRRSWDNAHCQGLKKIGKFNWKNSLVCPYKRLKMGCLDTLVVLRGGNKKGGNNNCSWLLQACNRLAINYWGGFWGSNWIADACSRAATKNVTVWLICQLQKQCQSTKYGLVNGILKQPEQSDWEGSVTIGWGADGIVSLCKEETAEAKKLFLCAVKVRKKIICCAKFH